MCARSDVLSSALRLLRYAGKFAYAKHPARPLAASAANLLFVLPKGLQRSLHLLGCWGLGE